MLTPCSTAHMSSRELVIRLSTSFRWYEKYCSTTVTFWKWNKMCYYLCWRLNIPESSCGPFGGCRLVLSISDFLSFSLLLSSFLPPLCLCIQVVVVCQSSSQPSQFLDRASHLSFKICINACRRARLLGIPYSINFLVSRTLKSGHCTTVYFCTSHL